MWRGYNSTPFQKKQTNKKKNKKKNPASQTNTHKKSVIEN